MTDEDVKAAIGTAIRCVATENPVLDFLAVHERSTAHRLAVHMEPLFGPKWNVDCEYDRHGFVRKTLAGIADCDDQRRTDNIVPDIIVHHRGAAGVNNNLLVVELKKHADYDRCDCMKLELLTSLAGHYQYQLGLYINIANGRFELTWFKDGARQ